MELTRGNQRRQDSVQPLPSGGRRAQSAIVDGEKVSVHKPRQPGPVHGGENVGAGQCPEAGAADAFREPEARKQQFLAALFRREPDALSRLEDGGFLALDDHRLRATPAGRQRLNAILTSLLPAR